MDLRLAQTKARTLMDEHGLFDWTFKWDGAKNRLGATHYSKTTISMSRHLTVLCDDAEVIDTILHEIAHALVGSGHQHDEVWREMALSIGSDGKRCSATTATVPPNWIGMCPMGHKTSERYRRPRNGQRHSCHVHSGGTFDARYVISWIPA